MLLMIHFGADIKSLVADVMLPYQYQVLQDSLQDPEIEKSHSIENFRIAAGESHGEFYGQVFQDSDTYKWLEAVAYTIQNQEDRKSGETSESAKKEAENAPNNYKKVSLLESRADEPNRSDWQNAAKRWISEHLFYGETSAGKMDESAGRA